MRRPLMQQLARHLEGLRGSHQELLEVIRQERQAIVAVNLSELRSLSALKLRLSRRVSDQEAARRDLVSVLAGPDESKPLSPSLRAIAETLPTSEKELAGYLMLLGDQLRALIGTIRQEHRHNAQLLSRSLDLCRGMLGMGSRPQGAVYTARGEAQMGTSPQVSLTQAWG